jgi:hypothetical protein
MTLDQFNKLSQLEKLKTVWASVVIAKRADEIFHYELYQINNFYVEVRIWKENKSINTLHASDNTEILKPYSNLFDISGHN